MATNHRRTVSGSSSQRARSPPSSLRRPLSSDSLTSNGHSPQQRTIRTSASTSSLRSVSSTTSSLSGTRRLASRRSSSSLRKPIATKNWGEPTLEQLMRQEEELERQQLPGQASLVQLGSSEAGSARAHSPASAPASGAIPRPPVSRPSFTRTRSNRSTSAAGSPRIGAESNADWGSSFAGGLLSRRNSFIETQTSNFEQDLAPPPESAVLHPPLYGRPGPSPSPDIFATLLQPILTFSRPPSPALSAPDHWPSRSNSPVPPSPGLAPPTVPLPADRSSSSLPAHFPPRRSSDPGPTVESQGFVLYIGSLVVWVGFLGWGLLKDEWLEKVGVAWYPSREWTLLAPAWTIMLAFFVYSSYLAVNLFITPSLDSIHTLTDPQAYILPFPHPPTVEHPHPLLAESVLLPQDAVPPLHDMPLGLVNRVTFGDRRRRR